MNRILNRIVNLLKSKINRLKNYKIRLSNKRMKIKQTLKFQIHQVLLDNIRLIFMALLSLLLEFAQNVNK